MKKKLWILGDSFASPFWPRLHFESWEFRMGKKYDTLNLALDGTGPDYSVGKLLDLLFKHQDTAADTSVIFLLSHIFRFNFKFFDSHDQVLSTYVFDNSDAESVDRLMKYDRYRVFMEDFMTEYVWHSTYYKTEFLKTVGLLKMLSQSVEKMLVWPVFDQQHLCNVTSDSKFFYVEDKLADMETTHVVGRDTRPNHMSECNHDVMFRQLSNWVDNKQPIDTSLFYRYGAPGGT